MGGQDLYMFLVDHDFISSLNSNEVTGHFNSNDDIVHCYSSVTLYNIAKKLLPEKILIDIDLVEDDYILYCRNLRSVCSETDIIVLINPNDYESLRTAIEEGSIDDYVVKPIILNHLLTRIHTDPNNKIWGEEDYIAPPDDEKEEMICNVLDSLEIAETDKVGFDENQSSEKAFIIEELDNDFDLLGLEDDMVISEYDDSFTRVFGDSPPKKSPDEPVDDYRELEDILASEDEINIKCDLPVKENIENNRKSDPPLVRPAEEFHSELEPCAIPELQLELGDGFSYTNYYKRLGSNEIKAGSRVKRRQSTGSFFNKLISTIGNLILVLLLSVMALVSIFLILSRASDSVPQVAGYQFYIIKSAAMSPEISDGSLALGRETDPARIAAGDIITFYSQDDPGSVTAGRVVEVSRENGLNMLTTRESISAPESRQVSSDVVIGLVIGSVPYIGQLIDYAQTFEGLILLIFVPGILIIVFQMGKIVKYFTRNKNTLQ